AFGAGRRFSIGTAGGGSGRVGRLERPAGWKPCDTAGWKPALRRAAGPKCVKGAGARPCTRLARGPAAGTGPSPLRGGKMRPEALRAPECRRLNYLVYSVTNAPVPGVMAESPPGLNVPSC